MRIVVSGTHASGKSTLIADFVAAHPGYTALPDPFELIDESWDAPGGAAFAAQLRLSADRLRTTAGEDVIAERGPLDFLAYLIADAELDGRAVAPDVVARGVALTAEALADVDLLVLLPLNAADALPVGADEHPELRDAMDQVLLELADDPDLVGVVTVIEISGSPTARCDALDQAVSSETSPAAPGEPGMLAG